jgi:hypothetical protein
MLASGLVTESLTKQEVRQNYKQLPVEESLLCWRSATNSKKYGMETCTFAFAVRKYNSCILHPHLYLTPKGHKGPPISLRVTRSTCSHPTLWRGTVQWPARIPMWLRDYLLSGLNSTSYSQKPLLNIRQRPKVIWHVKPEHRLAPPSADPVMQPNLPELPACLERKPCCH